MMSPKVTSMVTSCVPPRAWCLRLHRLFFEAPAEQSGGENCQ